MTNRIKQPWVLLAVMASTLGFSEAAPAKTQGASEAKPPNFIIFYTDDLGYADTSVQMMSADPSTKHKFINTPGAERLAEIGARFTAGYSPSPTCTASRLSIQFGKTTAQMQYRNVFDVLSPIQRPDGYDDEVNMAEMLKASGKNYVTSMFGKGCGVMGRYDENGYDITDEIPGEISGNGNGHGSYWDPISKKTPFPADNPKRLHSLRRDSVKFLNEYAGKQPFFMMVSHYAPHIPFMCTKEAFERTKTRWIAAGLETKGIDDPKNMVNKKITYAAMIEEMDMNMVAILETLEAKGELDNTYIIYTSDNGGGFAERREVNGKQMRFNGPLQGGKRSMFEGGLRVPMIISGPGIKPGSECKKTIVQWDFLPTFHDLSGSTAALPDGVDGGSLRDVFKNGNNGTVKRGAPGIVSHYPCHYHPPISSIIIGDFKLMKQLNSGEFKLFNIQDDYQEMNNLAASMPEKVASMESIREKYVDDVDGGTIERVQTALYDIMDEFGRRSRHGYKVKLAALKKEYPDGHPTKEAALLKDLNADLKKHEQNKEKTCLHAKSSDWKESSLGVQAKKNVDATWVDVTE